jgi:hypothetical protein
MSARNSCARLLTAGAGTLLIAALAACAGTPAEPPTDRVPVVERASDLVLPLDEYRLSWAEYRTVQRATWRLIRDCVARFGGQYTLDEAAMVAELPPLRDENERRYGLFDLDDATARGYNLPPEAPSSPPKRWNPSPLEVFLINGATGAFADRARPTDSNGVTLSPDGCLGESDRVLAAGERRPPDDQLGAKLSLQSYGRAEADGRVRALMQRWSACMKKHGYDYTSIWEPNDLAWPDPAGAEEMSTAAADVRCKHEVKLVETWYAVETAYQRLLLEQNAQALAEVGRYVRAEATTAARIVGDR